MHYMKSQLLLLRHKFKNTKINNYLKKDSKGTVTQNFVNMDLALKDKGALSEDI